MSQGKLIIFSAPSGAGKTTLVRHLLTLDLNCAFSVSATTRKPRVNEIDGQDYYFLSKEEFKKRIEQGEFLEWEEVYEGCYYGTLKSEVDSRLAKNQNVLFDIDVVGGLNIKQIYGSKALALFVSPPSIEELEKRLQGRSTDTPEVIGERIAKAELEMGFKPQFDVVIINDQLQTALDKTVQVVREFLQHK